jgi:hypothetical protein
LDVVELRGGGRSAGGKRCGRWRGAKPTIGVIEERAVIERSETRRLPRRKTT